VSLPGSTVPALSTGFGVVFSDVDHVGSASIRFFDARGRKLGRFLAPAAPGGLSFVGAVFASGVVASVEIRSGNAAVVTTNAALADLAHHTEHGHGDKGDDDEGDDDHRGRDLVIMDDFIYGEPIGATSVATARVPEGTGPMRPAER